MFLPARLIRLVSQTAIAVVLSTTAEDIELELELIDTNPNGTEANAAGRSVRACDVRKSKS